MTSTILLMRSAGLTGAIYPVEVRVDGVLIGELRNSGQLAIQAQPGDHEVSVAGGGLSRTLRVGVRDGETLRLQTYFSAWGFLGGGLNLKPAS